MTLGESRELMEAQVRMAGCNRKPARLILAEAEHEHGPQAVDHRIREIHQEPVFGINPGASFRMKSD
ncbi:MAG: hypothetical protein QNJ87_02705 [Gammaproteobacteria bacterium]|nr:hypothetical protein [Gammaproteobacteria bacterium]MDJ0892743.1 hypothetical protein [Gammaproteobacteria bacterium]